MWRLHRHAVPIPGGAAAAAVSSAGWMNRAWTAVMCFHLTSETFHTNKLISQLLNELLSSTHLRHYAVNACLAPLCSLHLVAVTTVEGIGSVARKLHPVQVRPGVTVCSFISGINVRLCSGTDCQVSRLSVWFLHSGNRHVHVRTAEEQPHSKHGRRGGGLPRLLLMEASDSDSHLNLSRSHCSNENNLHSQEICAAVQDTDRFWRDTKPSRWYERMALCFWFQ